MTHQLKPNKIFNVTIDNKVDKIVLPATPLFQIFLNLISNSLKYSNQEVVEIKIAVDENSEYYNFKYSDNGIGIAEDKITIIFKLFYMVSPKVNPNDKSTRVGLTIIKSIIEQLGGNIDVQSTIGIGTQFIFQIKK